MGVLSQMNFFGIHIGIEWFTTLITLIGAVLGYLGTKLTTKKDLRISEREQLSNDQHHLISELKSLLHEHREQIDELKTEISKLQQANIQLTIENNKLSHEIAELNEKLTRFNH